MTILPKKKPSQQKSSDGENVENVGGGGGSGGQIPSSSSERYAGAGRASPPQGRGWHAPLLLPSDRTGGGVGGNSNNDTAIVDGSLMGLGSGQGSGGPGQQLKRRHRASPHRNVRNKRSGLLIQSGVGGGGAGGGGSCGSVASTSSAAGLSSSSGGGSSPHAGTSSSSSSDGAGLMLADETFSGYNSGDEYSRHREAHNKTEEEWDERERMFEKKLRKKGFVIKKMGEDGACLFRAVADQVYGDQEMHNVVRKLCMDYMAKNVDYFSQYVTEDFENYLERKRLDHIHGNQVEMQAICEMYNRSIEVFHYSSDAINTFHGIHTTDNEPIRISYHKNIHYNSIVDPYKATVGVGLGLPGFVPGSAEKNLMRDAVRQSEEFHIEQAMLEDKLKATDWEATNEAIEEQVARESYLQWLRDNERRNRKGTATRSSTATCSSSGACGGLSPDVRSPMGGRSPDVRSMGNRSPRGRPSPSAGNSPAREEVTAQPYVGGGVLPVAEGNRYLPTTSVGSAATPASIGDGGFRLLETASFISQLPPDVFGLSEWEDADILAQVLAASQQEYLDGLKQRAAAASSPAGGRGRSPDHCHNSRDAGPSSSSCYVDTAASGGGGGGSAGGAKISFRSDAKSGVSSNENSQSGDS